ncbi:Solute carrier family 22 member 13 [Holothuria leucospilota]|uniref:Solute carrier family 22 member 13 n=1 Tax=Holothuria leucospilota TaxID=206669 RepID=A0A9Q1CI94_HOLLE|nr:Solute carrier family 22 member 13 [Holothuria leucospilota]
MDFDSVLREVGDFGKYQKRRLVLLGFPVLVGSINVFLQVFIAGKSGHWCQSWESEDCGSFNVTEIQCENFKREISVPVTISEDGKKSFEQCEKYNVTGVDFEAAVGTVGKNVSLEIIPCDDGWVHDRSRFSSTIIMDFELVCGKSYFPHIAQSVYIAGRMVGWTMFGLVSDTFGRRKTQLFSFICGGAFAIAITFSLNFWMYVILRFISAVLLSGASPFVLANEMVGPSRRVLAGNVMWINFAVGYGVLAGLAKLIPNWRILQLVVTLPYILFFILTFFFIHESPRWLVNQSRTEDAEKVLRKMARENNKPIRGDFTLKNCTRNEIKHSINLRGSFLDLIRSPVVILMMINMAFNWTVQAFVYYGLSLSTSELGIDPYISFVISGAIEIPAYFSCVPVAEWLGRKGATFVTLFLGGIACCVTPVVPIGIPRAIVAMMGKFLITMSFSVAITWALEMIPTSIRSSVLNMLSVASRLGAMLAPVILILQDTWSSLPVLIFGSLSIVAALLCLLFPETKGKPLPATVGDTKRLHSNNPEEFETDHGDGRKNLHMLLSESREQN